MKKTDREQAPSPSVMIAWAVVRAMEKHAPFRRLILEDDQIVRMTISIWVLPSHSKAIALQQQ